MLARVPINGAPLPNYDLDRDVAPGLTLRRSAEALDSADPTAVQRWRWTLPAPRTLASPQLSLWASGAGQAATNQVLLVSAGLYRCQADGSGCAPVGVATAPFRVAPGTFTGLAFDLSPSAPLTVDAGQVLEVRVAVPDGSDADVVVAYDSIEFPAQLAMS
jgi:hypothetical protein